MTESSIQNVLNYLREITHFQDMLLFCYLVRRIVHADRCGILGNNLSSVHFRAHIMHRHAGLSLPCRLDSLMDMTGWHAAYGEAIAILPYIAIIAFITGTAMKVKTDKNA